eukprot:3551686-Pleurochrysis_carterae.AAC.2
MHNYSAPALPAAGVPGSTDSLAHVVADGLAEKLAGKVAEATKLLRCARVRQKLSRMHARTPPALRDERDRVVELSSNCAAYSQFERDTAPRHASTRTEPALSRSSTHGQLLQCVGGAARRALPATVTCANAASVATAAADAAGTGGTHRLGDTAGAGSDADAGAVAGAGAAGAEGAAGAAGADAGAGRPAKQVDTAAAADTEHSLPGRADACAQRQVDAAADDDARDGTREEEAHEHGEILAYSLHPLRNPGARCARLCHSLR